MYLPMAEYVSKLSWRKTQWQRDRGERKGEDFLERENRGSDWTKEEEEEKKKDLKCEVGVIYTEVKSALVEKRIKKTGRVGVFRLPVLFILFFSILFLINYKIKFLLFFN